MAWVSSHERMIVRRRATKLLFFLTAGGFFRHSAAVCSRQAGEIGLQARPKLAELTGTWFEQSTDSFVPIKATRIITHRLVLSNRRMSLKAVAGRVWKRAPFW